MDYVRSLNDAERARLRNCRVAVIGCGGTGGYIAEQLIRIGVGHIVVVDGDTFCASNLNRQLYCTQDTLGAYKALQVRQRALSISPNVEVTAVAEYLTDGNAESILSGCDIVFDALDNLDSRRILHSACSLLGIDLVFGAIGAWRVQVAVLPPDCDFLNSIPAVADFHGESVLPFIPALCASLQVCEAVKILSGNTSELRGELWDIDLLSGEMLKIQL